MLVDGQSCVDEMAFPAVEAEVLFCSCGTLSRGPGPKINFSFF